MTRISTSAGDGNDRNIEMLKVAIGVGNHHERRPRGQHRGLATLDVRLVTATFADGSEVPDIPLLFALPSDRVSGTEAGTAVEWPTRNGEPAIKVSERYEDYDSWVRQILAVSPAESWASMHVGYTTYITVTQDSGGYYRAPVSAAAREVLSQLVAERRAAIQPYVDILASSPLASGRRMAAEAMERYPADTTGMPLDELADAAIALREGQVEKYQQAVVTEALRIADELRVSMTSDDALYAAARAKGYDISSVDVDIETARGHRRGRVTAVTRDGAPIERTPAVAEGRVCDWRDVDLRMATLIIKEVGGFVGPRGRQAPGSPGLGA